MIILEDQSEIAVIQVLGYRGFDLVVDIDGDQQVIDIGLADLLVERGVIVERIIYFDVLQAGQIILPDNWSGF